MRIEPLVAPIVVFAVVCAGLIGGRVYDRLPVQLPPCGVKKWTGIPCPSCRGTRSIEALSRGQVRDALRLNPLAVLACGLSVTWLVFALWSAGKREGRAWPIPPLVTAWVTGLALLGNWCYLILTDHWFP